MKVEVSDSVITSSLDIMSGAPVFTGTRVPVAALFENLKDGATIEDFLEWFPGVKREQVIELLNNEIASLLPLAK